MQQAIPAKGQLVTLRSVPPIFADTDLQPLQRFGFVSVAKFISPKKVYTLSSFGDYRIPKSV